MRTVFDDVIDFHDQRGCIKFQAWDFKAVLSFIRFKAFQSIVSAILFNRLMYLQGYNTEQYKSGIIICCMTFYLHVLSK